MLAQIQNVRRLGRLRVLEIAAKSALSRVEGMPFNWSLNPYRGCQHGCWYCYARRTHTYLELDAGEDFSNTLVAKTNIAERLRADLGSRRGRREDVAVGTATDPYQPLEGIYRLTRSCLEVFAELRWPFSLITKSAMAVRDADLFSECSRRCPESKLVMSVPILDQEFSRLVEPRTSPPRRRLEALAKLRAAGVRAGVNLAPILPGLNDSPEQINLAMQAAADHGAEFVGAVVLHLNPAVRDYFFAKLSGHRPELLPEYRSLYGATYPPRWYRDRILTIVDEARRRAGMEVRPVPQKEAEPGLVQLELTLPERLPSGLSASR